MPDFEKLIKQACSQYDNIIDVELWNRPPDYPDLLILFSTKEMDDELPRKPDTKGTTFNDGRKYRFYLQIFNDIDKSKGKFYLLPKVQDTDAINKMNIITHSYDDIDGNIANNKNKEVSAAKGFCKIKDWPLGFGLTSDYTDDVILSKTKKAIDEMLKWQPRCIRIISDKITPTPGPKEPPSMDYLDKYINMLEKSGNIILTGAPGTGKTFLAQKIAAKMIGIPIEDDAKCQAGLKNTEQYGFVQFHPSYDYTDFVEGLRPMPPDINGNIGFDRKNGVFKDFCKKALKNYADSQKKPETLSREKWVDEQFDKFADNINDTVGEGGIPLTKGSSIVALDDDAFRYKQGGRILRMLFSDIKTAYLDGNDDRQSFMKNSKLSGSAKGSGLSSYYVAALKLFKDYLAANKIPYLAVEGITEPLKKYIFVIDEINRGEISKIFGELFFSIDPGYRGIAGIVKTQYTNLIEDGDVFKSGFYIPENVYVIGTMNDIDRSVDSFDFAMRRRFTWIEVTAAESAEQMKLPQPIIDRMTSLNDAISKIPELNPSYHIGGAYFLKLEKYDGDYEKLWQYHLEPLIHEYLRGIDGSEDHMETLKKAYNLEKTNVDAEYTG